MRFVPIKTPDQQAVLALHRVRSLLVRQRTATINAVRGLLGEFGIVAGKGASRLDDLRRRVENEGDEELPAVARKSIDELFGRLDDLAARVAAIEGEIVAWHKGNEASQRLAMVPGIEPITASALVASVGDARQFKSSRHGLA